MTNVATEYTTKELMAAFVASEIEDGEAVSVGASLPVCRAGILLAHLTHAPNLKVQMSFTMTNLRNVEVLESFEYITDWRAARWAEFFYAHVWSQTTVSMPEIGFCPSGTRTTRAPK